MTITRESDGSSLVLVWNARTKFIENWQFTAATSLRPQTRVTLYYRSPLFGERYATQIMWVSDGPRSAMTANQE